MAAGPTKAKVQFSGKGEFKGYTLTLSADHRLAMQLMAGGKAALTCDVAGCEVSAPKSARKGHEHCIRLDLKEAVQLLKQVHMKFILALPGTELQTWRAALHSHSARGQQAEEAAAAAAWEAARDPIEVCALPTVPLFVEGEVLDNPKQVSAELKDDLTAYNKEMLVNMSNFFQDKVEAKSAGAKKMISPDGESCTY